MSWRRVLSRATNKMLGSWSFPGKEGNTLWKLQSSRNEARLALQEAYTHFTKRKVKQLSMKVNGVTTYDLNLPLNPDFSQYPAIKAALEKSKFITYRYGPLEHYMTFIYDDGIQRWVPLLAEDEVINLADWLVPVDDKWSMEQFMSRQPIQLTPIAGYYWGYHWSMFLSMFYSTQLMRIQDQQLKKEKHHLFITTWQKNLALDKTLMWIFCDGQA